MDPIRCKDTSSLAREVFSYPPGGASRKAGTGIPKH